MVETNKSKVDGIITMINNIKYNNNTKNTKNTNFVSKENEEVEELTQSSVLASPVKRETLVSQGTLPAKWKSVKIDLFANPNITVKLNIIRLDGTQFPCTANLNSPATYVFRGRDRNQGDEAYWQTIQQVIDLRQKEKGFCISKITKPRKGGTIDGMAIALYQQSDIWCCDVIYHSEIYQYQLKNEMSEKFIEKNGIATGYYGQSLRRWVTTEELGI